MYGAVDNSQYSSLNPIYVLATSTLSCIYWTILLLVEFVDLLVELVDLLVEFVVPPVSGLVASLHR